MKFTIFAAVSIIVFSSLACPTAIAFSIRKPIPRICAKDRGPVPNNNKGTVRRGDPPSIEVAAEYETVSDIQKAVELHDCVGEDYEDCTSVQIRNDMVEPLLGVTREDLLNDVQEMMEAQPLVEFNSEEEREELSNGLLDDIAKKFSFLADTATQEEEVQYDMVEAQISSSLYMNPATEKIASHVKITWEPEVARTLSHLEKCSNPNRPFMVGLVGIPGSGKSTSAEIIQAFLGEDRSLIMPMDGFHIPLAELAEMENPADVIYRRGAPDTFHAAALKDELHKIAYGSEKTVSVPGFDHAVGDPTPDQHTFLRDSHRIVLCEGLYLLHDDDGWEDVKSIFDWTIYIDADVDACIERLKERNKCIPVR